MLDPGSVAEQEITRKEIVGNNEVQKLSQRGASDEAGQVSIRGARGRDSQIIVSSSLAILAIFNLTVTRGTEPTFLSLTSISRHPMPRWSRIC